jgi:SAM-dependent methyltransferase
MNSINKISQSTQERFRCPICHARVEQRDEQFICVNPECETSFPIVNGIPILINEKNSLFSIHDFVSQRQTFFNSAYENKWRQKIRKMLPSISKNINGKNNYHRVNDLLLSENSNPCVLILGGSILGDGLEVLAKNSAIDLVESDVAFGPRTGLISDAHDIPFLDQTFDAVIVQAVLEHVVDPYRCSEEIHRVLKDNGIVYAETPFMQQVHAGRYDFTRFTHLGHRRLFRKFDEIDSGAVCGPGMALAWSYTYFLMSFTTSRIMMILLRGFAGLTSFYLKYFDSFLINKPGTMDAASGFYFIGRKSNQTLSDQELITRYRGQNRL